ncbi:MAG: hypothetical protein H6Q60_447 [Oscillospiraceae bacterium]|nr:hypothetical protein [Oscillospiraceae bacterium]
MKFKMMMASLMATTILATGLISSASAASSPLNTSQPTQSTTAVQSQQTTSDQTQKTTSTQSQKATSTQAQKNVSATDFGAMSNSEIQSFIKTQTDSTTKTKVTALYKTYATKDDAVTSAKKALVAGLTKYNIKNYETNGTIDVDKVQTAINQLKNSTAVKELTTLLTNYKNAVTAHDTAKESLLSAMQTAGYVK